MKTYSSVFRTFSIICLLMAGIVYSAEYRPVSVYTAAETSDGHEIGKIHDALLSTTACLFDESRTGKDAQTIPANGSDPVTGTLILDFGTQKTIRGVRLTAKNTAAPRMAQKASLFTCDDPQGKMNVRFLLKNRNYLR
ncbi:MAG: hypothetical protein Q4G69_14845 [Planctomycetia bacterium]|nr:hypothetical protein [Planctomycetia bacterium]